jgi:Ca2+-dependent lipid-binding protein
VRILDPCDAEGALYFRYEESGVLVFNILSGNLSKKARLEVSLDEGYWPCFSTIKARSNNAQWETVGEGFVKELDFGRVWLRLNEAEEGEKDDIIAEWKGDSKVFLKSTLVRFLLLMVATL